MIIGIATNYTGAASGHLRISAGNISAPEAAALRHAMSDREMSILVLDSLWFQANRDNLDGHIIIYQGIHNTADGLHVTLQWYPVDGSPKFGHLHVQYSATHNRYISLDRDVQFVGSNRYIPAQDVRWMEW